MRPKPPQCDGCPLCAIGNGFATTEGTGSRKILVLGEALGKNEAQDSLPFRPYAQAGSQLNQILKEAGLNRGELLIYNIISCQPPRDWLVGAPWEIGALEHCRIHWEKIIKDFRPKVIVTLGDTATRTLTGLSGHKKTISYLRGYVFDTPYGLVLPSYHPSFIKRGKPNLIGVCVQDFLKAQSIAKNGWNPAAPHYLTVPTEGEIQIFYERCKAQPPSLIAFDIETDYSLTEDSEFTYHEEENGDEEETAERQEKAEQRLIMVQFSAAPGTGMALAFIGSNVEWIKKILALPNPKAGHNAWRFDIPNLERAGITVAGTVHDTMWMFKHSQPDVSGHYNLQSVASFYGFPFPWKHLSGTDLNYYGCCDVDAVQRIMQHLPYEMKAKGVWDSYQHHIVDLEPVLSAMSRRGLPVNDARRLALRGTLELALAECDTKMQAQVPQELFNCKPKNGYKRTPKDTTGLIEREFCVDEPKVLETSGFVTRWCKVEPFRASNQQVLRYIHHCNHPKQYNVKTGKETSDVRALERLIKKTSDPLYRAILDYRTTEKLISTYVDGWKPGPDGRVHPQFLYKPATGQLSSIGPNAQNPPAGKGKDTLKVRLAQDFRRIIEAPGGYKIVEFDFKSFHGMTMALEAQDPDYMRLAKIDMHSFLTSYIVKEPARFDWPDGQLRDYLNYIKGKYKMIRDSQAKPAILGAQFGLGAISMAKYNWEYMNESEAQKMLDLLDDLFPKVKKFKYAIMVKAHKQHRLLSRFGYNRWFWDVMRWDARRQCMVRSEQAEQAIAFLPANDAFGHKKEIMLQIYKEKLDELYGMVNEVHDSLVFLCPEDKLAACVSDIKGRMERPSTTLVDPLVAPKGLSVEVEVKMGQSWAEMTEIKP